MYITQFLQQLRIILLMFEMFAYLRPKTQQFSYKTKYFEEEEKNTFLILLI